MTKLMLVVAMASAVINKATIIHAICTSSLLDACIGRHVSHDKDSVAVVVTVTVEVSVTRHVDVGPACSHVEEVFLNNHEYVPLLMCCVCVFVHVCM